MFLFYFESQNIVFRMHIMQFGMKFPFQKYITLRSYDFILIDQKRNSNTHPFVLPPKILKYLEKLNHVLDISVALSLRKVTTVEKLSDLVHFGYFF